MNHNMKLRRWSIVTLGLILTIALVILVWNKESSIYPYLFGATALASLLAFAIIGYCKGSVDKFSTIFLILIVFLFLRNVRLIAVHYGALEPSDVTYEYAVINTFAQMDKIFVIPPSAFWSQLTSYSSWPLLHTFSLVFADILGIKNSVLPMALPTVLSSVGFLFVYLITDRLTADLELSKVVLPLSLLLYAIFPEAIHYGFKFIRNSFALVFILVELYLLHKYISHRDPRILALVILNAIAIVLSHHYSSFIFTVYLLVFAGLTFVLVLVSRRAKPRWIAWFSKFCKEAAIIGIVGLLSAGAVFAWWSQVATVIQPVAGGATTGTMQTIMSAEFSPYTPEPHYAESLTPPWVNLLWLRDFLLYIPIFFGFGWLIRKRFKVQGSRFNVQDSKQSAAFYFLILSLICFGALFLFEFFISHVAAPRIIILSLPLITLCSALAYEKLLSRGRWLRWLTLAVLVFVIVSGFLGLEGHRHAPVHLYCSAVSPKVFGQNMTLTGRHYELQQFVSEHALDREATVIFSDNTYLLYLMLPPEEYTKIASPLHRLGTGLHDCIVRGDDLLVIDFGVKSHRVGWGAITGEEAEELRSQYRAELEPNLDKVYDNGFEVWLSPVKGG